APAGIRRVPRVPRAIVLGAVAAGVLAVAAAALGSDPPAADPLATPSAEAPAAGAVEPAPVEPTPVEPAPVESAPVDPAPVDPAPAAEAPAAPATADDVTALLSGLDATAEVRDDLLERWRAVTDAIGQDKAAKAHQRGAELSHRLDALVRDGGLGAEEARAAQDAIGQVMAGLDLPAGRPGGGGDKDEDDGDRED
ncbi:MAG: hypothetical protein JWP95_1442, partial [Actinotalea sp.]|nr:hypothetical protein [Actinotalea sp.]